MTRLALWSAVLAALLAGGAAFLYRSQHVSGQSTDSLVRSAWTDGRNVALKGDQVISLTGTDGKPLELKARVLTSANGHTRIEYVDGPLKGVTIWENGERTYRYNPRLERLTVAQKRGTEAERREQELQLLENYEARVTGEQTVAGRSCLIVELRPKSGSDRWKRVAIDPSTSVILVNEDRRGPDHVLRRTAFTDVQLLASKDQPPPETFHPPADLVAEYGEAEPGASGTRYTPETLSKAVGFPVRGPRWIPEGYALQGGYLTPCACKQPHQAARLEYWDGLNTITLFQCAHPACSAAGKCFGAAASGPMAVHLRRGKATYLAIGEAKREDLSRMIESLP